MKAGPCGGDLKEGFLCPLSFLHDVRDGSERHLWSDWQVRAFLTSSDLSSW